MCAAIVQLYYTYSLYYLVLFVSSDLYALYLYYFATPTQILRVLAAPTQLVPATTSHSALPLNSQRWRSCSGSHGGAPVTTGDNPCLSHPCAHIQVYHLLNSSLPQDTSFWGTSPQAAFSLPRPRQFSAVKVPGCPLRLLRI